VVKGLARFAVKHRKEKETFVEEITGLRFEKKIEKFHLEKACLQRRGTSATNAQKVKESSLLERGRLSSDTQEESTRKRIKFPANPHRTAILLQHERALCESRGVTIATS